MNSATTEPVLGVTDAVKRFGTAAALDHATVELRRGEWLALLGPNGAGKTTLVRAIAGRVRLDEGSITLLGAPLTIARAASRGAHRELGIVPQEIALYPRLTAAENLRVFGRLMGLDRGTLAERVAWALEFTALADRASETVDRFSGGMKRRLNIACSVLHRPPVVLLDEPTVGVDPQSRQRIWEMLDQLRRDGASLLLTTHQLDEAQQICDRIVVIDHGRVIADGTFDQLVRSTVGAGRRVTITLDNHETIQSSMLNIGAELPPLLAGATASGAGVADVQIEAPTLQAVFIHLTGRELRD